MQAFERSYERMGRKVQEGTGGVLGGGYTTMATLIFNDDGHAPGFGGGPDRGHVLIARATRRV